MKLHVLSYILVALITSQSSVCEASGDLFAVTLDGDLMRLDMQTGDSDLIGSTGIGQVGGLAFNGSTLYAYSLAFDSQPPRLYTIDSVTGHATVIGELGIEFEFEGGLSLSSNGSATIISGLGAANAGNSGLFDVDLSNGSASGSAIIAIPDINGLVRRGDGMLVGWSQFQAGVFTIDAQTNAITVLKSYSSVFNNQTLGGMAKVDDDSALLLSNRSASSADPANLYSVDLFTGELSLLQSFGGHMGIAGIAVAPSCLADLTGEGELNFFDVSAFLSAFSAGDSAADLNGDGTLSFFDVSVFLKAFAAGCP